MAVHSETSSAAQPGVGELHELAQQLRVDSIRAFPTVSASRWQGGTSTSCPTPSEEFPIGGAKVLRSSSDDQVTLIGAGVTVHECLAAAEALDAEGIHARVIDLYSIKPIDGDTCLAAVRETGRLVIAEDHHPEGGIASAVLAALAEAGPLELSVASLAVRELPGSGTRDELMDAAGISAPHIAEAARSLVTGAGPS